MTALLWSRTDPGRCACDGAYRPQLNAHGTLVKAREPAWRMMEQTRDPGCLQEHCRSLGKVYRLGYQHHKYSRASGGGYPDVHLWTRLRPDGGGHAHLELKRMGEHPRPDQVRVMAELQDAGALAYLVRPCCLLVGVVDELMADFAGRPCLYVKDGPAYTPVEVPAGAPIPARPGGVPVAARAAAAAAAELVVPARRLSNAAAPLFRRPPPPGGDPMPFAPADGYVVPQPAGTRPGDADAELEDWLRSAGFAPVDVPYPMRLIVGPGVLHVQCRIGLARAGVDERVWRGGAPARPFPVHLVDALHAEMVHGATSAEVADLIGAVRPRAAAN